MVMRWLCSAHRLHGQHVTVWCGAAAWSACGCVVWGGCMVSMWLRGVERLHGHKVTVWCVCGAERLHGHEVDPKFNLMYAKLAFVH